MFHDPSATYLVVVNDEGQHSLWPEGRSLPDGWVSEGFKGTKSECLDEIAKRWTDMRPRSLGPAPTSAAPISRVLFEPELTGPSSRTREYAGVGPANPGSKIPT